MGHSAVDFSFKIKSPQGLLIPQMDMFFLFGSPGHSPFKAQFSFPEALPKTWMVPGAAVTKNLGGEDETRQR